MFFMVDDQLHVNTKITRMLDDEGPVKASPAIALWTLAGSFCRASFVDGVVTLGNAGRLLGDRRVAGKAAAMLVEYGLWHTEGHTCAVCPPVAKGSWLFHQWFQFGYGTGDAEKTAIAKRKELRNASIVEAVWARDTGPDGVAHCRYCGTKVQRPERGQRGGTRRGAGVGQLDHVDPTKAIGPSNIAVACPDCNQRKGQRTPEQAGLTLRPAPSAAPSPTPSDQTENQTAINTGSSRELSPLAGARVGVGEAGVGHGSVLGSAGVAPTVPVAARHGSPWHGHHGPPPDPDLVDQATCPDHDLPTPCRRCADQTYRETP